MPRLYIGNREVTPAIVKGSTINNQDKTIIENGVYTADEGYTGLGEVTVEVSPEITELNVTPTTSAQVILAPAGTDGYSPINVAAVTSSIDANIIAGNIKKDVTILGVTGTVEELNGETKVVTPTTSQQVITPSSGKNAITRATIEAVTSSIDANIIAGNIKKDVTILGVTGTLEEGITPTGTISITENGTIDVTNYASANVNVSGGGSTSFLVKVIDYDGTILKQDRLSTGATFTLPSPPSHTGLTFQSWSSPVTITNNTVTVTNSDIVIGATYTTASGLSEFDISLTESTGLRLSLYLDGTKDWGDGTSDNLNYHDYSSFGDYTITCNGSTYSYGYGLFGQGSNAPNYSVKNVRLGSNISSIRNDTVQSCCSLKTIVIPSSVTSISDSAFQSCYSLTSIVIPEGVTSIGQYAFREDRSCVSIAIPSSVTSIGNRVFQNCRALTNITIPEGVTSIGQDVFENCYSLTGVTIPSSVTSISNYAFYYCYSLSNVIIPNSVTSIGSSAFNTCYSLSSVVIPSSVTSIGNSAFQGCFSLSDVTISEGVINIEQNAFRNCYSLPHVVIPEGVTSIKASTFQGCDSLASIIIPEGVTSIDNYAFYYCHTLANITVPSSVTSIGTYAFSNCDNVTEYDFSNHIAVPTLSDTNAFNNINKICRIKVPASLEAEWKSATNWSTYTDYIVGV